MSCSVCDGPIRPHNKYGICNKTPKCRTARQRRLQQTPAGRQYQSDWHKTRREANPGKMTQIARQAYVRNHAAVILRRARAGRAGVPFELTKADMPEVPAQCPILGIPLEVSAGHPSPNSPSLDRMIPELGYIPGNVWWISHLANSMKNSADLPTLRRFAQWVLTLEK